jgi:hypothetical protein
MNLAPPTDSAARRIFGQVNDAHALLFATEAR